MICWLWAAGPADVTPQKMSHEDIIGEAVCEEEALEAQKYATIFIVGGLAEDLDIQQRWMNADGSWRFAGSQPVGKPLLNFLWASCVLLKIGQDTNGLAEHNFFVEALIRA